MNREGKGKAPIAEIDLEKEKLNLDIPSRYQAVGPTTSRSSKASIFKELPSFVEDFDNDEDVRKVLTQYNPGSTMLDMTSLQALLSTLVKVSLPLANVLKVKPKLW